MKRSSFLFLAVALLVLALFADVTDAGGKKDCCKRGQFCCGTECKRWSLRPSLQCAKVPDKCCNADAPTCACGFCDSDPNSPDLCDPAPAGSTNGCGIAPKDCSSYCEPPPPPKDCCPKGTFCCGDRCAPDNTEPACSIITDCSSYCEPSNPCDAEPKVVGPCEAATPSWSFIKESGKCERFLYGGCEGTANRFDTEADCKETCNVVDEPPKEDCCPKGEFCCGTGCLPDDQAPFVRCSEPMCTCEPVEPEPCVCTLQFDPVCDPFTGTTYGNRCEAECANVDPDDLVDGECVYEPGPPGCTPTVCTHSIPPHCACV